MSVADGTLTRSDAAPDKSAVTARAILQRYLEGVRADFACSVDAVVLIGSLATGGYVPGPGDIDQVTILRRDAAPGTEARLQACIDGASAAYGGAVHLAPIVYRRADLERPRPVTWDLGVETRHLKSRSRRSCCEPTIMGKSGTANRHSWTPCRRLPETSSLPVSDVSDVGIVTSNGCIHGWILPSVWRFPLGWPSK